MYEFLLTLHETFVAFTVGTLFLQSMALVTTLRLNGEAGREGARQLQRRLHRVIYYPVLLVALLSGLALAWHTGAFSAGMWLHWKLVFVVVLVGLGFWYGHLLTGPRIVKPAALAVHVLIFACTVVIVFLAAVKPF